MKPTSIPRTALALAALSVTAFFLSGCVFVDVDRGGGYSRRPPPGHYDDGYHRGGPDRRW
ncbi:MAG: hypothetical protein AVDCRST_MAG08-1045 [uncultured Acetobacteraceae bacterium]|uniref:Lipoprotein n=1 Tax=uncultured Acetobacteraceae bacterium TaxID=169975 RepID=A0A6J4HRL5_9PROT|nr:MAG: hypothetical protein AVDCRST_MAG08-1045 [uncultured Acetobacteraceae bacterium]